MVTVATSQAALESVVLGRHEWSVTNDSRQCSAGPRYTASLSLSVCTAAEFACRDGSCVPMTARCDGRTSCRDKSDEQVGFGAGYKKFAAMFSSCIIFSGFQ